jgi:methionine-gamma-lyase
MNEPTGPVTSPIYQTSTFGFSTAEGIAKAFSGETSDPVYTRFDNPTVSRVEEKLASLERSEAAAFFSSGMAAISTAVLALVRAGDHVVAIRDLYGGTYQLMRDFLPRFGVEVTFVDTTDIAQMRQAVRKNTRVVYIETPSNPMMRLVDIRAAAKVAHSCEAALLVDNTFASPINQKPVVLGADLSIHSATKYLNGHADVIAGAVAGSRDAVRRIKMLRRTLGGSLDPHAAWLVMRGMKTLSVRVQAQNRNAMRLAEYLSKNRNVKKVYYPGLRGEPQRSLALRQMSGFGGMLSFETKGRLEDAMGFTDRLKLCRIAASLGGVETLVSQPAAVSHRGLSPAERAKSGLSETLIRVSVGLEDPEDVIADFEQAFRRR